MRQKIDLRQAAQKLRDFQESRRRPPSFDEVRRLFRYRSKNAAFWLVEKLREKGALSKDAQGKLIVASGGGLKFLGAVQAGFPSPAEEELVDTMNLQEYLVKSPDQTYLIRVTGDSMKGAGIQEGDLVLVERGRQAREGDIVIAQVDGEWTMKYYEKRGRSVVLVAANAKYPPIEPQYEMVIGGVIVGVIRKYK